MKSAKCYGRWASDRAGDPRLVTQKPIVGFAGAGERARNDGRCGAEGTERRRNRRLWVDWTCYRVGWSRGEWRRKGFVLEVRDKTTNAAPGLRAHVVELDIFGYSVLVLKSRLIVGWGRCPVHARGVAILPVRGVDGLGMVGREGSRVVGEAIPWPGLVGEAIRVLAVGVGSTRPAGWLIEHVRLGARRADKRCPYRWLKGSQ